MIPHARELPPVVQTDYAQIALDRWVANEGPKIRNALLNRKPGEDSWYFPCTKKHYAAGEPKICGYMFDLGYKIQWFGRREGRYADPDYGTQGDIPSREEGYRISLL